MTTDDATPPIRPRVATPRHLPATDDAEPRPLDARLLARRLEAWAGDGTLACWVEDDARTYELALATRLMEVDEA